MSLFKRGNKWWMELYPKDAKPFRESTGTSDEAAARKIYELRKAQVKLGIDAERKAKIKPKGRTWDDATSQWLIERASKRSIEDDRQKIEWLRTYFSGKPLTALTRDVVYTALEAKRKATSNSTANRYLALIRSILRRARDEWEWIDKAPKLSQNKEPPGRTRFLTPEEIDRLLQELPAHQRLMAKFALGTGQRVGAITQLKWERVDLDRGLCWIDIASSKTANDIPVPLNDAMVELLRECIDLYREPEFKDYVFVYKGRPVSCLSTAAFKKALKRAGITDYRWHDNRHTWASYMAMNGTPIEVLQKLGGWKNLKMPQRYAHFSQDALKPYAKKAPVK